MEFTRRKTLIAAGATVGLGGCVDRLPGTADTSGGGNGNADGTGDGVAFDVFQLDQSLGRPLWVMAEDATGFVTLVESEDDRLWMVDDPGEVDGLEAWLDETDFEESTIVYVETVGPNTCYSEIDVRDVAVEAGAIVGTAAAVDTSDENVACGSAETYPSAFVRVTGDDLPADAAFTVTDGRGESSEVAADGRMIDPEQLPGHVRPAGDPAKREEFSCDEADFERHWSPDGDVAMGDAAGENGEVTFAMRVHGRRPGDGSHERSVQFGRGDEVRVTMWNVSDEVQYTGNRHKYNLQVLTVDGWQDVRGTAAGDPLGYTDEGVIHRPGEGFEWSFEMTEEGVLEGHVHEERLEVCPDLQSGRYRFVYHEAAGEPLAVEFDYTG